MILRLNENGYTIIFYKMKPSILKILIGVMYNTGGKFVHCETGETLESLITAKVSEILHQEFIAKITMEEYQLVNK
jgi:hypothetical protein